MLTQHWTVKSITDIPTLSPHKQQPASQTPHPDSSTSNATQTQLHTVAAETRHTHITHQIEDGVDPEFVRRQAGHTYQSTTAIYTGVSTDFMNTMMRKALDTAFATDEERQG